jgi:uncharacterized protein (TIGR00730 family)
MTKNDQKKSRSTSFWKKLAYRKKPSYHLKEEYFLVERENFGTGLWRATRMFIEYMKGFYAFRNVTNCVTIFGSARFPENSSYYEMAKNIGYELAKGGFTVMTGGGPGIMEAANRGAKEGNGRSLACNIKVSLFDAANSYVDQRITLRYFFVRKVMLTKYSLAYIFLPGGIGTLDEFFEMTTLIQQGKVKNFPLVLMGKNYWMPLFDFIINTLLANQTIHQSDVDRMFITDSAEEALQYIKKGLSKISNGN